MPFISEAASAIRTRFGFQDRGPAPDSVPPTSPEVPKSISKSSVRTNILDREDDVSTASGLALPPHSQSFEFSEDPSFWKDHNVQVIIRVRPLSSAEISSQGHSKCVRQESCQTITWTGQPESRFTFDLVADETVSQEKLFKVAGVPMVENCMGGYNSCMFAYGQTGSGKTHTMLGDIEGGTRRHSINCGMTPRVFEYLFSRIQKEKDSRNADNLKFTCKCSFLEIYNEQILDLLDPSSSNLQIREDVKKGVHVENLKEIEVTSARDVIQQLIQGAANRKVAATNMNCASSRSHSVFTCVIESKWETQGVTHHRFARLNLVDLAGSERQKSSGAEGERLKEATNINKSLSTLGLVIMNLVSVSNGKSLHVPYRDSKLTFLLQDSLGGNSKTTIIANISPALCCSLETLSTLKFAQRAKFIKNNAIVNEDASGDVIAMRLQIQQLKKEVAHLRGLAGNGAESMDDDASAISFLGSPGAFKWEGLNASFSPLAADKKMNQKKDYELALVGAFKREKDKDISLKALAAENQATLQLAKQREDEIKSLKMRLRFREAAVKRLEAVASGKILAEIHLLKEKEEHLREIEVLRNQVDRNQEVTRFAMENLRLKEEIRRLKSFYEEGEREMMSEQLTVLQDKLLEALDWKLMHDVDSLPQLQNAISDTNTYAHDDLLLSTQGSELPSYSQIHEENEFLRMQAIQNQAENDTLRKQLEFCLEEKEKLERHVSDILLKLEEERSKANKEGLQLIDMPSLSTVASVINFDDQMELKTMVDAIASASQREAEAHERAIILSKENAEMRLQLEAIVDENNALHASVKALIEEKNSLIEMYERAASESSLRDMNRTARDECDKEVLYDDGVTQAAESKQMEMEIALKNLEHQLLEMHEENEKLMGLYEKAMHERDEFKRKMSSGSRSGKEAIEHEHHEMSVGVDRRKYEDECSVPPSYIDREVVMEEIILPSGLHVEGGEREKLDSCRLSEEFSELIVHEGLSQCAMPVEEKEENWTTSENESTGLSKHVLMDTTDIKFGVSTFMEETNLNSEGSALIGSQTCNAARFLVGDHQADLRDETGVETRSRLNTKCGQTEPQNITVLKVSEDLNVLKIKLETMENKLSDSAKIVTVFGHVEEAYLEFDKLSREEEEMAKGLEMKQKELRSFELLSSEIQERKALIGNKLSALKASLSSFSSSVAYFEHREARLRAKLNASLSCMDQKRQELSHLQASKCDIEAAIGKNQQSEAELRNKFALLKSKFEEENQKQESEKVLFAIDNTEKVDKCVNLHLGKATDLLKSTEEKTKLQTEIMVTREKLCLVRGELEDLRKKSRKLDCRIDAIQREIEKSSKSVKEMELAFHGATQEKDNLLETREHGKTEIERMFLEYHQNVFGADLKEAEINILGEELMQQSRTMEELRSLKLAATERMNKLLEDSRCHSFFLSRKMEEDLQSVHGSVLEAKAFLGERVKSLLGC